MRSYKTCGSMSESVETFDEDRLVLSTLVCQTHSPTTNTGSNRFKRAIVGETFQRETQFVVAVVDDDFHNSPPVLTKEHMLTVAEDYGESAYHISHSSEFFLRNNSV